jgi:2'-5' RNA ligase
MALAKSTRKAARAAAIEVDGKAFSPHVTVIRKATAALPVPLYTPHIEMHASAFHLFESVSTPQGATYPVRQSWNLKHNMSVREKLRRGINDE